ncbi:MAG: glycosyltransferase family 4 protein [Actinobacteria bacterium]|nr:glycosyltransferase family 4 protein [Actinomycetota bacterium]
MTKGTENKYQLGIVVSHPIQYHVPLYRRLVESDVLSPTVLFLSRHGVDPTYDGGFNQTIRYDVDLLEGYPHQFLPNVSPKPGVDRPWGLVNFGIARAIRRYGFDAVLVHGYAHISNWLTFGACVRQGVPLLLRGESRTDTGSIRRGWKRMVKDSLIHWLLERCGACLAIGQRNADFYRMHGVPHRRIFFSPYSVSNDSFAEAGRIGRAFRDRRLGGLGLDPQRSTILFAAKLQPWKRPLDMLRLAHACPEFNVVIIGDGPLRGRLAEEARVLPNVRLLGFVNQSEIGQWYGVADVFVLPSEHEPWGLAVNEAMAGGCVPAVSEAVGCAPDLVAGGAGLIFPIAGIERLADELRALMGDSLVLGEMKDRARERVRRFSIDTTARGIERAIEYAQEAR